MSAATAPLFIGQPSLCPTCNHTRLIMYSFVRGLHTETRYGCLCSTRVLFPPRNNDGRTSGIDLAVADQMKLFGR
jgi:DNA-directed RNA polymerase subunit RPC12/RpoP